MDLPSDPGTRHLARETDGQAVGAELTPGTVVSLML